jgi:predicted nucleotidyltransferase
MTIPAPNQTPLIYPVGTRVVILNDLIAPNGRVSHPRGAVAVVVKSPSAQGFPYRVQFTDGMREWLPSSQLTTFSQHYAEKTGRDAGGVEHGNLFRHVILRCVIGSQAYGLAGDDSDIDRRGVYLPPADLHWSLFGVPEQLECEATQEAYWEVQKFLVLALKANPNVLECLYTPLLEHASPLAAELLGMREVFLSRLVYQTYNGYVMSQFKKMQADLRNHGAVKWKHVMHLIRLLISGVSILREAFVPVRVESHREQLLAIKRGEVPWEETEKWRLSLHCEFDDALKQTKLPDKPDYERANQFLIKARHAALKDSSE